MNIYIKLAIFSFLISIHITAQATSVAAVPAPSQDPTIENIKLTKKQASEIEHLYQQMEMDARNIKIDDIKDGVIVNIVRSGKWDEEKIEQQLKAFDILDHQMRYYRIKYYYDINNILTPEQRLDIKNYLVQALN
ncbi:MAG TPA: hypothetical protein VGI71_17800 [Scandinavium sp.]